LKWAVTYSIMWVPVVSRLLPSCFHSMPVPDSKSAGARLCTPTPCSSTLAVVRPHSLQRCASLPHPLARTRALPFPRHCCPYNPNLHRMLAISGRCSSSSPVRHSLAQVALCAHALAYFPACIALKGHCLSMRPKRPCSSPLLEPRWSSLLNLLRRLCAVPLCVCLPLDIFCDQQQSILGEHLPRLVGVR